MKTLQTIGLVLLMLVMVASFAVSPWWLMPVNSIALMYMGREVTNALAIIWSGKPEVCS